MTIQFSDLQNQVKISSKPIGSGSGGGGGAQAGLGLEIFCLHLLNSVLTDMSSHHTLQ